MAAHNCLLEVCCVVYAPNIEAARLAGVHVRIGTLQTESLWPSALRKRLDWEADLFARDLHPS
jgi:hypothetical protein